MFAGLGPKDARGVCFAALLTPSREWDVEGLKRAAALGEPFAQACLASIETQPLVRLRFAQQSAELDERDGHYELALCLQNGVGDVSPNAALAIHHFERAARLGRVDAAREYGRLFAENDAQRWYWLGKAAARGDPYFFVQDFFKQVRLFEDGVGHAHVVFAIGRALKGQIDKRQKEIFAVSYDFAKLVGPAVLALEFFESQSASARKAVDAWTLVGIRFKIIKDVRVLIGKLVWEAREDATYEVLTKAVRKQTKKSKN